MSQRKSPVVQHTLTGPRGPTSRGRSHRPQSKGNLYIANPDTDSDSDDPQRSTTLGTTPTPASQISIRGSATSNNLGTRDDRSVPPFGSTSVDRSRSSDAGSTAPRPPTMGPQDREWQQQRQQIARGLTVVTQPPTPGVTGLSASEGNANHFPNYVAPQYQPSMGNVPTVMTGMPLGPTSSLRNDIPSQRLKHAANDGLAQGDQGGVIPGTTPNNSVSPLNTTYGISSPQSEEGEISK